MAHPVAVVAVADEFLADRELGRIWRMVQAANPEIVRQDIVASEVDAAAEFAVACAPNLFGEAPFLVVDAVEQSDENLQNAILELIADPNSTLHVLLMVRGNVKGRGFVDKLKKSKAELVTIEVPKGKGIDDFVVNEFKSHKRKVQPEAVKALRDSVGDDFRSLAGAVSQLSADVETDPISEAAVQQYYEGMAGVAPYVVVDSMINGHPTETLSALRWALERDPNCGPAIVATALNTVRGLVAVASAPSGAADSEIASAAGVPPWKVRTLKSQVRRWPPRRLADATLLLTQTDAALKAGRIDALGKVEVLEPVQRQALLEKTLLKLVGVSN